MKRFYPNTYWARAVWRTRGFTLIELIVTLAIVVLLIGLILPVLVGAKAKAKRIQCLSNGRQWGLAVILYAEDHDELFPYEGHFLTPIDQGGNRAAWYNTVPSYANLPSLTELYQRDAAPLPRDRSIFVCPSVTVGPKSRPTLSNPFFMYGFNNRMDPNGPRRFQKADLRRPAQTVIFTENSQARYPSTSGKYTPARHRNKANLVFGDGHAASVHTNEYRTSAEEDLDSRLEWNHDRRVYWYPYPGAPP